MVLWSEKKSDVDILANNLICSEYMNKLNIFCNDRLNVVINIWHRGYDILLYKNYISALKYKTSLGI